MISSTKLFKPQMLKLQIGQNDILAGWNFKKWDELYKCFSASVFKSSGRPCRVIKKLISKVLWLIIAWCFCTNTKLPELNSKLES